MRDLRRYSRATSGRLILGGLLLLFGVGGGLIWWRLGPQAASLALLCLALATAPILLIAGWLAILDRINRRMRGE